MDFRLTDEQTRWKQEIIEFLAKEATPDFLEGLECQKDWALNTVSISFSRKLAAKGWLGLTWPKEYGGQERPYIDQAILDEQMGYYYAPKGTHQVGGTLVGLCILRHGTAEQKAKFVPPIVRQEVVYAQGFTEPQAGTDLASLATRAVRDKECYVITGEKHYCSDAHYADYIFLATRTDPNVPKHAGISLFVVDLKTPGVTIRPMTTVFHGRLNQLLFDNVRVPAANLIGNENEGWKIIMTTLAAERGRLYTVGSYKRLFDELVVYARETKRDGRPVIQDPIVKFRLAEWATILEAARLLSWRVAWMQSEGMAPGVATNIESLFLREREHEFFNFAMEVLGRRGQLQLRSKDAQLLVGRVERMYRRTAASTGGGGNIELSKNIIALRGLGLPK